MTLTIREARADHFERLLAGEAPELGVALPDSQIASPEVLVMLADLAVSIRPAFSPAAWMIIDGDRLVGLCSLHKVPEDGVLTIGYGVAPTEQGRGAAGRAIAALLEWSGRGLDLDSNDVVLYSICYNELHVGPHIGPQAPAVTRLSTISSANEN